MTKLIFAAIMTLFATAPSLAGIISVETTKFNYEIEADQLKLVPDHLIPVAKGAITLLEPKVELDGVTYFVTTGSEQGLCALLGEQYQHHGVSNSHNDKRAPNMQLNKFGGPNNRNTQLSALEAVTCKLVSEEETKAQ